MMSCKGFLSPDPSGRLRMTRKHTQAVEKAFKAAIDHAVDQHHLEPDLGAVIRRLGANALEDYPRDRSCHTCDFLHNRTRRHWEQDVPCDALDAGCDKHREQGVTF